MASITRKWDLETEVLVVGTGGAALTAAILAHDNGAKVTLIEKSDKVGGTTAVSGGGIWVPNNHHMAEKGWSDSREDALKYCKKLTKGRAEDELVETYVDTAPGMIKYLEEHTPLRLECVAMPDYHPELEGGHMAEASRTLSPLLFDKNELGEARPNLRPNPFTGIPVTLSEMQKWEALSKPFQVPFDVINERMKAGLAGLGEALIGSLYKACLDRGIEPILNTRARDLVMEEGRVTCLLSERKGSNFRIGVRKGIILACGGFEWNNELKAKFLPGEITHPHSPPYNEGDGLKMAMAVGADLGNMSENWGFPSMVAPGIEYEGRTLNQCCFAERSLPHSMIVNKKGKRFVNEAANYSDMSKSFWILDPNTCEYANLPAWLILDQQYFEKYSCMNIMPGQPVPDYIERADSVEGLAKKVGIGPEAFTVSVRRFNEHALRGVDPDFQRGKSAYDRTYGDPNHKPNSNLGTIEKPPFYAFPVYCGSIGTKGGPKINRHAQVLHASGQPIPGLYAAGNVAAGVSGPSYWGAGGTIGPAMVFGYIAGCHAAGKCFDSSKS